MSQRLVTKALQWLKMTSLLTQTRRSLLLKRISTNRNNVITKELLIVKTTQIQSRSKSTVHSMARPPAMKLMRTCLICPNRKITGCLVHINVVKRSLVNLRAMEQMKLIQRGLVDNCKMSKLRQFLRDMVLKRVLIEVGHPHPCHQFQDPCHLLLIAR